MNKKTISVLLVLALTLALAGCSAADYKKAEAAFTAGDYEQARAVYEALGEYKDCRDLVKECDYQMAKKQYGEKSLAAAVKGFEALGDYKDSAQLLRAAEDELISAELTGNWISADIDGTELFTAGMNESMADSSEDFMKHFEVTPFIIRYRLTFTEQGTIVESVDQDVFNETIESIKASFSKAFLAYLEEAMQAEAEEAGLTYDDILKYYEITTTEELAEISLGMTVDEFTDSLLGQMLSSIGSVNANGTYSVEDGVVSLNVGEQTEKGTFDLEKKELTLTGEGVSEQEKSMYPIVFTKVQ